MMNGLVFGGQTALPCSYGPRRERERMFPAFEIFSGTWEYISFALEHEKEASFYLYTWVQGHEAEQVRGQNIT